MSDIETMDSTEQQTNGQNHEQTVANAAETGSALKKEEPIVADNADPLAATATNGVMEAQAKEETKEEKMDDSSVKSEQQQVFGHFKTKNLNFRNLKSDNKNYEEMEAYKMFMAKNLNKAIATNLIRMFVELELNTEEFDDRAVEMLASFPVDQANYIVKELKVSEKNFIVNLRVFNRTPSYMAYRTSPST